MQAARESGESGGDTESERESFLCLETAMPSETFNLWRAWFDRSNSAETFRE